jgi:acyl-coenzyme A thioesterase PaaI-like protein
MIIVNIASSKKWYMNSDALKFRKKILKKINFSLFSLKKLPSLAWWGVRLSELDDHKCVVTIPFKWRTQNPFGSMYFAAQAGAAELSTGLLCMQALSGRGKWSMYVVGFEAEYGVTAKTKISFICNDAEALTKTLNNIEATNTPEELVMVSTGLNTKGEMVSKFNIKWSFKKKA